jgi:Fuc2NAc and GlcNAc transferase
MTVELLLALCAVAASSWGLVALVRRYASARLMDVPGTRSSHSTPRPRGGGIAIVATFLGAVAIAAVLDAIPGSLVAGLLGGGALVALIGFLDDHGGMLASVRFACHGAAFVWVFAWLGTMPAVDFGWGPIDLPIVWSGATLFYLLWFLNLFNFMDGIDGIATTQTLTMTLTGSALMLSMPDGSTEAIPSLLLAAAASGFLLWNWPPARIFMGDVGSGFLGFTLGVVGYATVISGALTVWVWLILGAAFVADASVTLFRRIARGERISDAHRSHAYQRLARRFGSHRSVTLLYLAVNLAWLGPLAYSAVRYPEAGASLTAVAWGSLFVAAWRLGAGLPGEIGTVLSTK